MRKRRLWLEAPGARRPLTPGEQLGRGGEAVVHAVEGEPQLAVKLWQNPSAQQRAKLAVMLRSVPDNPPGKDGHRSLAWPLAAVTEGTAGTAGFVMPRLDLQLLKPLHQVYHPGSRRRSAPGVGWHWLVRVARNLSATLNTLHGSGYIVGDLNESNVLADPRALVTFIDLDSIQVRDGRTVYRCPVGKAEYTPPELAGKSFREVNRRPASDVFALAVLVFQLLMEGNHPFSGVWHGRGDPPGLERNIRSRRSAWLGSRQLGVPPAAPPARVLPPRLRRLFARSLLSPAFARPRVDDWQRELGRLEENLKTCRLNPLHTFSGHLPVCPWCERQQLLGVDPFPRP